MRKIYKCLCVSALLLLSCPGLFARQRTITGTVKEPSGSPIPGVNVVVKGTTIGTLTDADGKFALSATPEDVLVVSFNGYTAKEIPSFVEDGKPGLRFSSFIQFTPMEFSILN